MDSFLIFHVTANSFLWQMVRRIVDSLLKVGQSQWQIEDLKDLLNGTPKAKIFTVPRPVTSSGTLILWDIEYPFRFQSNVKSLDQVKMQIQRYLIEFSINCRFFKDLYDYFDVIESSDE